jgi:hypothetical protein
MQTLPTTATLSITNHTNLTQSTQTTAGLHEICPYHTHTSPLDSCLQHHFTRQYPSRNLTSTRHPGKPQTRITKQSKPTATPTPPCLLAVAQQQPAAPST